MSNDIKAGWISDGYSSSSERTARKATARTGSSFQDEADVIASARVKKRGATMARCRIPTTPARRQWAERRLTQHPPQPALAPRSRVAGRSQHCARALVLRRLFSAAPVLSPLVTRRGQPEPARAGEKAFAKKKACSCSCSCWPPARACVRPRPSLAVESVIKMQSS